MPSLCAALVAASFLVEASAHAEDGERESTEALVVIVDEDSPIETMSLRQLRRIFLGEQTHIGKKRLVPFNLPPDHDVRRRFDRLVLNMSHERVGRYWIDRKIRGQGTPPKSIGSTRLLQRVIARFPTAIGYVRASELGRGVRALRIDGRSHTDPGYPLVRRRP